MGINALSGVCMLIGIGQAEQKKIMDGEYTDRVVDVVTKDELNMAQYIYMNIEIRNGEIVKKAMFTINEYMEDNQPHEYALYAQNDGTVTTNVPNRFPTPKAARERLVNYLEGILKRNDLDPAKRPIYEFVLGKIKPKQ